MRVQRSCIDWYWYQSISEKYHKHKNTIAWRGSESLPPWTRKGS